MLALLLVALTGFGAAALTLYSGFGLGTLLLPVFALFFPVEVAVAATAVVHGANNVIKVALVGRHADWPVAWRFGVPAILAAFAGAGLLAWFAGLGLGYDYEVFGLSATITPVKLAMGGLMAVFALFELLPRFRRLEFERRWLPLGGVLSGFFGGLSGHQGALRAAFLAKAGLDTPGFVGTNAVIGLAVDLIRIAGYAALFSGASGLLRGFEGWDLVTAGIIGAFTGVVVGKRFLHKVTMGMVQTLTGILLLLVALLLGSGVI